MTSAPAAGGLPELAIVVVNWNSGALLARCLDSVAGAVTGGVRVETVVVVDNASTDGSADRISTTGIPVTLLRNSQNKGFAAACNAGAGATEAPVMLFLNPDTELSQTSLEPPLRFLTEPLSHSTAIVGIRLTNLDGSTQRSCARFPTPARMVGLSLGLDRVMPWLVPAHFMREWDHDGSRYVDQTIGAFLMMRRRHFNRLGGFDERFFLYMEDVDLALRARRAGLRSYYLHLATARHAGGGTTRTHPGLRLVYSWRSRVLYARKHFGIAGRMAAVVANLALEPAVRLLRALALGRRDDVRTVLAALARTWRHYPFLDPDDTGPIDR